MGTILMAVMGEQNLLVGNEVGIEWISIHIEH